MDSVQQEDNCFECKYYFSSDEVDPCRRCRRTLSPSDPLYDKSPSFFESRFGDNPYWNNICKIADDQRKKGIAEYGQGLEAYESDIFARINHLEEELVDALMYCEWIKEEIRKRDSNDKD